MNRDLGERWQSELIRMAARTKKTKLMVLRWWPAGVLPSGTVCGVATVIGIGEGVCATYKYQVA